MRDTGNIRQELHTLLDRLPESGIPAARDYLRTLVDPVESALAAAPDDDEPLSEHERTAIEAAGGRRERHEPSIPHGEVLREFGLTGSDR